MPASEDPGKSWRAASGIPVVAAFDGFRALAIGGVVLFHVLQVCGALTADSDSPLGVALWGILPGGSLTMLFIVSGFVMFLPAAARSGDLGPVSVFAIRRAARLVPAYYLSLVVALLLLLVLSPLPGAGFPGAGEIAAHFGLVQTPALLLDGPVASGGKVDGGFQLGLGVVPPVWTLSVEVGFYLVLPFVAGAYYRRPFVGLAVAAAILAAWYAIAVNAGSIGDAVGIPISAQSEARIAAYYASQLPTWGLALAAGMTCAWLHITLRRRFEPLQLSRWALRALLATIPLLIVVFAASGLEAVTDVNPFAGLFARQPLALSIVYPLVMAAAMIAFALAPEWVQRPLTNRPVRAVADISYGVYLIHFAVIWVLLSELSLPTGSAGAALVWAAIVYPVSLGYAYLSARLLERPVRRWAHRFRDRARAAQPLPRVEEPGGDRPPVTIVIPTHNRCEWVGGAIDSLLAQDYPNLELLVVDDGSSDRTGAVLESYASRLPEERFRFLRQRNSGQAVAINRGNGLARGEILGYLSDDDLIAPGLVSRLTSELLRNRDAAVAYPAYHVINERGEIDDTVLPIEYSPLRALRLHDTVIGPGGLARRSALESAGGWDPGLRWMADLVLWMGVGLAGPAIRVPEPLASWRHHGGSVTLRLSIDHAREHLAVAQRGTELAGMPSLSRADRAEALRNACLTAALFAGESDTWPGDRFVTFDLHRKRISAWSSAQPVTEAIDEAAAGAAADRYRELVTGLLERAEPAAPVTPSPGPVGLEAAMERLQEVGAVPGPGGGFAPGVDERTLRVGLVEAALACGAEVDLASSRYLILDRERARVPEADLEQAIGLGYQASAGQIDEALRRRR